MSSSSELSISSSIPVIFPARVGCKAWISGYSRSPVWDANSLVILLMLQCRIDTVNEQNCLFKFRMQVIYKRKYTQELFLLF